MGTRDWSRSAVGLLAALVAAAVVPVTWATPAAASGSSGLATPSTQIAYTDSAHPDTSYVDPGSALPLGARSDTDGLHVSRDYQVFDISAVAGRHILSAQLTVPEATATTCTGRTLEVWQTADGPAEPTWSHPRRERALLGSFSLDQGCPGWAGFDLTKVITQVAAQGLTTFPIEVRLSGRQEKDPALGRTLTPRLAYLEITYNSVPSVPTKLTNGSQPCATHEPLPYVSDVFEATFGATFSDPDQGDNILFPEFAIWPVGHPDQTQTFGRRTAGNGVPITVSLQAGSLGDGGVYAWHTRTGDTTDTSPWSPTCLIHVDSTAPAVPGVSSPDYPPNALAPGGVSGRFTFTPNGSADVASYAYSWDGTMDHAVKPQRLGGAVTITLVPPPGPYDTLSVRTFDRAGNGSGIIRYSFNVDQTWPTVNVAGTPTIGSPYTVRLAPGPHVTHVVSYTYTLNDGPGTTVKAAVDGTATITLVGQSGQNWLRVTSLSRNGWVSSQGQYYTYLDSSPLVTSDVYPDGGTGGGVSVPGTFTFTSRLPKTTSFTYAFDWGAEQTLSAAADGTATVAWTPDTSGWHTLAVYAMAADGSVSDTTYYSITVS